MQEYDLGIGLAELALLAFEIRQHYVREVHRLRGAELGTQVQGVHPGLGLAAQRFHITGLRIAQEQGVTHLAEAQGVRLLGEERQLSRLLIEHRHHCDGMRVLHNEAYAVSVVLHVAGSEGLGIGGIVLRIAFQLRHQRVHIRGEGPVVGLYRRIEFRLLAAAETEVSQGVGLQFDPVAGIHKHRSQTAAVAAEVVELRISLADFQLAGEIAGRICGYGVNRLKFVDIEQIDFNLHISGPLDGTGDPGVVAGRCGQDCENCASGALQYAFHNLSNSREMEAAMAAKRSAGSSSFFLRKSISASLSIGTRCICT